MIRDILRLRILRWSVACTCALWGCAVKMTPDAPTTVYGATCEDMCRAFERLGCDAAKPSPRSGMTCAVRCQIQIETGSVRPPVECVARAEKAEDLTRCGERCH